MPLFLYIALIVGLLTGGITPPDHICHGLGTWSYETQTLTPSGEYVLVEAPSANVTYIHTLPSASHSADIIPPVGPFPGRNWDAEGQAIWANGCEAPEV
jgi:hypothetical protein